MATIKELKRKRLLGLIVGIIGLIAGYLGFNSAYLAHKEIMRLDHVRLDQATLE